MKTKKRCPALSPGAHLRCELRKGHMTLGYKHPRHRVMNTYWSDKEGSAMPPSRQRDTATAETGTQGGVALSTLDKWKSFVFQDAMASAPANPPPSHINMTSKGVTISGKDLTSLFAGGAKVEFDTTPPEEEPMAMSPAELELRGWWFDQAEAEIGPLAAKAAEYGGEGQAMDLIDIGRNIARLAGREVGDAEATEIGCAFYAHGKMARIMAAIAAGRRASDDTWYDLGIYARMVQRTRAAGAWPGTKTEADSILHSMCTIDNHDGCMKETK
jgi:hypothetical protein